MRVVHFADIHLGYRQYHRQTSTGLNQREADIARVFRDTIDRIIELQPDLILIGGDVFHNVRPTNPAILHAYNQFRRLVEMLPDAGIVMVAGNHDIPRTSETQCLLGLFQSLGINVVVEQPKWIHFRERGASVFAVPHGMNPRPRFEPNPDARYNLLLIHDEVAGLYRKFGGLTERSTGDLSLNELAPERWNYVALGHYHVYHQVAPNAYYSGSLEYASTNIWSEVDEAIAKRIEGAEYSGKGFIEHNLETGSHRFHPVKLARRVLDLPVVNAQGLSPEEVSEAIRSTVEQCDGGIDDMIVRLIVREIPRHVVRDLDHRAIRDYKRRALNFLLDTRRPIPVRIEGSGAPGRRASLMETVRANLERRAITPGIDRAALVELGLSYLAHADRTAAVAIATTAMTEAE
ncbi:MAG TPA: DNA repair exonuclease [Gemmatimonadaceae bacterium]|nr:DNA repair exonuclease [Gemmatimonadaceae bacterium]